MSKRTDKYPASRPGRSKKRGFQTFIIILCTVGLIAAAAVVGWKLLINPPEGGSRVNVPASLDPDALDFIADPDEAVKEETEEDIRAEATEIASKAQYKDGFFTMLVVGLDKSENLTDTIVTATFDVNNGSVAVLNIPRDTISTNAKGKIHKLNSAYGSGGIERTITEVEALLGYSVDRYAIVDYDAFRELVDAIGGIDFNVPQDMYKNTGDMIIDLKAGEQHLDGEHALMYMRYRGYAMADLARIDAQQGFYQAVIEKVAQPGTILKLPALAKTVLDNVETDLTLGEMIWIGVNYAGMDASNTVYNTLPGTPEYIGEASFVIPDEKKILELINRYYNPYVDDITDINPTENPNEAAQNGDTAVEPEPESSESSDSAAGAEYETVPDWLIG